MEGDRKRIYLDCNATTPLEPSVLEAIHTALQDAWGNPSSSHQAGMKAKEVIDEARCNVAGMVGARATDIVFTSGGTEANNMVLLTALKHFWSTFPGVDKAKNGPGLTCLPHIVTSNLEHDSIRLVLEEFQREGKAEVTFVPASKLTGRVEPEDIVSAVRPTTSLVTVMMANNETGIIQPVQEITQQLRALKRSPTSELPHILLHTDAAQALGKIKVDATELGVDYLTIVGHKFYGPRIGALYIRGPESHTPLYPMFFGGGQERNFRPGYSKHMQEVRDYLESELLEAFGKEKISINGKLAGSERLPNTCNVSLLSKGLVGSKVLARCQHLQASVGAACHSGSGQRASPILLAIGIPLTVASNALRLSVGRETTKDDIDITVRDLKQAVDSLLQVENNT